MALDQVRPRLRVQLFRSELASIVDRNGTISKYVAGGIGATLVYDFGTHEETVQAQVARSWGKTDDELFAIGLTNALDTEEVRIDDIDISFGIRVRCVRGNGNFVGALALDVAKFLDQVPADRELVVAVPNWHAFFVLVPGRTAAGSSALERLAVLVEKAHSELANPVSPRLFRVRGSAWSPMP